MRAAVTHILASCFLFCFSFSITAFDYVKLTQLNTDDGLNQGSITGLMQDSEGYLWISSYQGINRFDGYRMNTLHSPGNILLNNYIDLMFEDSYGLIWIGADPQNNYQLDKSKNLLKPIELPAPKDYKLEYPVFNQAIEDPQGNIWFITFKELYFYDRQKDSFEFISAISKIMPEKDQQEGFRNLLLVNEHLLLATSKGLFELNTLTREVSPVLYTPKAIDENNTNQQNVKTLLFTQFNKIWVGTVEGLYEIEAQTLKTNNGEYLGKEIVNELNIWSIIEKQDFYWVATDKGLYQMTKSNDLKFIFKYSDTPFNTSDDDIISMIEDREGNLWFGSRGDGVFKWHPNIAIKSHFWNKSPLGSMLSENTIVDIHQTPDKAIWVSTENGLNKVDPITQEVTSYFVNPNEKEVISDSTMQSVAHNKGKLWVNSYAGISVYDQKTMKKEEIIFPEKFKKLFSQPAFNLYFFDQENLAIINEDGIYNYNLTSNKVSLIESTATKGEVGARLGNIFDTATGDRDSYFVSGLDRLVKYSNDTGLVTDFHKLPPSDDFRTGPGDLYRDGETLWVTYPGYGIYLLDANSGEEIKFISEQSIGANTVMEMFPDKSGNLWFTSNEGLLRINKENHNVRIFDSNDGFITSEFNGGTKQILDNGEVFLGSIKGVFHFSPDDMNSQNTREVTPHMSNISLLSGKIKSRYSNYDDYHVELNHDDFGLKFEFSALLFDKPKQVKYRYWLEGDSETEAITVNKSELFFPAIKAGNNTLNISAIDYDTGVESAPVKIKITSYPAPWLSTKAYISYVLAFLLISGSSFYRYRQRLFAKIQAHQKLKQSEERLNLALKGGNSGLWDWHAEDNRVYEPRMLKRFDNDDNDTIPFNERLQAIHEDDRNKVTESWDDFLTQKNEAFDSVYRMRTAQGTWAWYRDMATVTERDLQKNPLRVTGTFTNITERKEARDKMRLFSKAFENTRDIVFVLNQDKEVIAANQAFYKTTEYTAENIIGSGISFITDFDGSKKLIAKIFRIIHLHQHWEGEGQLIRFIRRPLPVLINATSFLDNDDNLDFVFALTDISKQKQAENELRKLANYDSLTGLPNRALLLDRISHAIEHCRRRNHQMALFFIDLDRFKQINDTLGHDIGDLLLINVAHTLRRSIRHDDTVARLGGDEFVVLLEDIDGMDSINRIAQNIVEQMKEPMQLRENKISSSPSIGIAIYPNDGDDAERLLKHADVAMYHAKNAGRNNFQYFENSMNHAAKQRLSLENKLRQAIETDEIYFEYQPQYRVSTGEIIGMEALARWKTSDGEFIPPSEFIPVAEDLGLIIPMTERLLEVGFENLSRWHAEGKKVGLAFNLSARHLHHYDFIEFLDGLLSRHKVDTELLEFELTESILMQDVDVACRIFGKLAEKGVELALDDFGTGYSSLKYLSQLPINKLKIDRSFVNNIGTTPENDSIIRTIISLAKSLNLRTVAEGVETEEQLEFIRQAGVDQAQGFLLSRPQPLENIETLLS